ARQNAHTEANLIVLLKKARLSCLVLKKPCPAITYRLCNVRRPRAGYGRPDVTVSGAPAKVVAVFS
ncbi:hypothetical protein L249_7421, partial [Ophiocordyceps polyrhachis-furcata BCC 54312]